MKLSIIQKELETSVNRLSDRKRIVQRLNSVESLLREALDKRKTLDKIVKKEKGEYERLEKMSISAVFHKVFGDKEQKLEKERQEYLDAVLKYNECVKDIELLQYEQTILNKKKLESEGLHGKIDDLLNAKESLILRSDLPVRRELTALVKKANRLKDHLEDVKEAQHAGAIVRKALNEVLHHLQKARDWGNSYSRSNYSAFTKYNHVDKARDLLYGTKRNLHLFSQELDMVFGGEGLEFMVEFPSFNTFSDIFFDNLISDWIFQSKVQKTIAAVAQVGRSVKGYMAQLKERSETVQSEFEKLSQARRQILMKQL